MDDPPLIGIASGRVSLPFRKNRRVMGYFLSGVDRFFLRRLYLTRPVGVGLANSEVTLIGPLLDKKLISHCLSPLWQAAPSPA